MAQPLARRLRCSGHHTAVAHSPSSRLLTSDTFTAPLSCRMACTTFLRTMDGTNGSVARLRSWGSVVTASASCRAGQGGSGARGR